MEKKQQMEEVILCASSAYEKKYYLNDLFRGIPADVKDEIKVMCVLFTEDVGGTMELVFDKVGKLYIRTASDEEDCLYDDVGSALKVKELQNTKRELLEALEMYYKVIVLDEYEEEK